MTYKVKLTKISNNTNRLRTNEIEGECEELPVGGNRFSMTAKGLEFGTRWVQTSVVVEVHPLNHKEDSELTHLMFKTYSGSEYTLEFRKAEISE